MPTGEWRPLFAEPPSSDLIWINPQRLFRRKKRNPQNRSEQTPNPAVPDLDCGEPIVKRANNLAGKPTQPCVRLS
jgi:hypothetical protein